MAVAVSMILFCAAPVQAQDAHYTAPYSAPIAEMAANASYSSAAEDNLQPGEFEWSDSQPAAASILVLVSLSDQRAYVYRGDQRIAISTISSGKPGMETPTGVYPILQKEKMHRSNLYDDAPMPFMQRLTWDGVALHAGRIPGHPASHGCVRLPREFARQLFAITERGQTVVVSDDASTEALRRAGLPEYLALQVGTRSPSPDPAEPMLAELAGGTGEASTLRY